MDSLRRFNSIMCLAAVLVMGITGAIWADHENSLNPYDEALRKCVVHQGRPKIGPAFDVRAGVDGPTGQIGSLGSLMLPWGGKPIEAFSDANAVPFLIDVAVNGPGWQDAKLLKAKGGILPHIARCVTILTLGATKDPRGLKPLIQLLNHGDYIEGDIPITHPDKEEYPIRGCAAQALKLMENPGAAEALMAIVKNEDEKKGLRYSSLSALTFTRDMRALPLIFEHWEELGGGPRISPKLELMLGTSPGVEMGRDRKLFAKKLPELGNVDSVLVIWRNWLNKVRIEGPKDFDKKYATWKEWKERNPEKPGLSLLHSLGMRDYGVATLPDIVEAIKSGHKELVVILSTLTRGEVKQDASREEVLTWWEKNKQRWTIPFDEIEAN